MRLDKQTAPRKLTTRLSARKQNRGYDVVPHTTWGETARVSPQRGAAMPTDSFIAEATVTASDATNAAKLAALGYVALPQTAWTTGQQITVGGFAFNWSGAAWAAGAHA